MYQVIIIWAWVSQKPRISSHISNNAIISFQPATPPELVLLFNFRNLNTFISKSSATISVWFFLPSQQQILFIKKQTGLIHNLQHKTSSIISSFLELRSWVNNTVINSQTDAPPEPLFLIFSCHPNSLIINAYAAVSARTCVYTQLVFIEPAYGKWSIEIFHIPSSPPELVLPVPVFFMSDALSEIHITRITKSIVRIIKHCSPCDDTLLNLIMYPTSFLQSIREVSFRSGWLQ